MYLKFEENMHDDIQCPFIRINVFIFLQFQKKYNNLEYLVKKQFNLISNQDRNIMTFVHNIIDGSSRYDL